MSASIPDAEKPLIENTVHGWPSRQLIRSRGRTWSLEHIEYAIYRVETDTAAEARPQTLHWLAELKADRVREIADELRERAAADRQDRTEQILAELKKTLAHGPALHWTAKWGFWVAVAAAVASAIAAWPVVQSWMH